ncbi:uncharacterized protein BcabD6B2_36280 [Babesia caballi]|uniref:Uncharacterized protein n=1 Tax=Babesia caballi TaxID=5871 RepID=A0AAV4LW19_BABCB|nr:hypothetical protein, conserved [Babesia caballi]
MAHESLTTPPTTLKEAIDWLLTVQKSGGLDALSIAVFILLTKSDKNLELHTDTFKGVTESVKKSLSHEFFESNNTADEVRHLLDGTKPHMFRGPLERLTSYWLGRFSPTSFEETGLSVQDVQASIHKLSRGVEKFLDTVKDGKNYSSVYAPYATWDGDCGYDRQLCAEIFVGMTPLFYSSFEALQDIEETRSERRKTVGDESSRIGRFMDAAGYDVHKEIDGTRTTDAVVDSTASFDRRFFRRLYDISGFLASGRSHSVGCSRNDKKMQRPISQHVSR